MTSRKEAANLVAEIFWASAAERTEQLRRWTRRGDLELAVAIYALQGHEETTAKMETVAKTMAGTRSLRKEKDMAKLTQQTAACEPEEALAEV